MIDVSSGTNTQYELNYKKVTTSKHVLPGKPSPLSKMDYEKKTTALDYNSKSNIFAVASLNTFFIYSA